MELKCIVCKNYYHIDEHLEGYKALGPPICSATCMSRLEAKKGPIEIEQKNQEITIGFIGDK